MTAYQNNVTIIGKDALMRDTRDVLLEYNDDFLNQHLSALENQPFDPGILSSWRQDTGQLMHLMARSAPRNKLEVVLSGGEIPLLMIPGLNLTPALWYHQFAELPGDIRKIFIGPPAHGRSGISRELSFESICEEFVNVLDALEINRPVHVMGVCMGGLLAQVLAAKYPRRVASLILLGSSTTSLTLAARIDQMLANRQDSDWFTEILRNDFDSILEATTSRRLKDHHGDLYDHIQKSRNPNRIFVAKLQASFAQMTQFSTRSYLPAISAQTLVCIGKRDVFFPIEEMKFVADQIERAQLYEIEDAGHFPNVTHHTEFNDTIVSFLRSTTH